MSLQKRSEAYARHMDEVFMEQERDRQDYSHEEYQEYCYLQSIKDKRKDAADSNPLKPLFDAFRDSFTKPNNH